MNEKAIELLIRAAYYRALEMSENSQANESDHEGVIADLIGMGKRYVAADKELRDAMTRLENESNNKGGR